MSYEEYLAKRRLDPEYRRIERRYKIICFVPDMLFRFKMWVARIIER